MAVIAPPRQPDSHDAEFTVEPDRGGEALIEASKPHAVPHRQPVADQADVEALIREARRRARRRRATVGAVVLAALASFAWATVLAFGFAGATGARTPNTEDMRNEAVPAHPVPSAELVASFYTHWSVGGRDQLVYVFDDGRVIFRQGSWQQRRLTPDGVESLRTGIIDSGILGPSRYAEGHQFGSPAFLQVRVDGVLMAAWQPPSTAVDDVEAFNRVVLHLIGFDDWLPAESWAQREMVAFVPPEYAVCTSGENGGFPAVYDALLPFLPQDAAAILAAGPRFEGIDPQVDAYASSASSPSSDIVGCRQLTPEQAQSVVDALVRAGWGVEDSGPPRDGETVVLTERERIDPFDMWTERPGIGRLFVGFLPILPHGVPECACVG
ncbi:hypothetical protein ACWEOH_02855 [Agromyces sp. NPDC004153]